MVKTHAVAAVGVAVLVGLTAVRLDSQGTSAVRAPSAAGRAAPAPAKAWTPSRTPWGDPNLQGNFTTIAETNTPLERPDEFEGKRREDFTPEELAAVGKARNETTIENYGGQPARHWFDNMIANNNSRPWLLVDPADGKIPPLTPRVLALPRPKPEPNDPGTYADMDLQVRCVSRGPAVYQALPMIYSNSFQILQTKDYVAIRHEIIHERRIIPIEGRGAGRPHNPSVLRDYYGDSVARWEGNTLVVDTTNFQKDVTFRQSTGETLHTIERFTRTAPNRVEWTITVDDPQTWTKPWTYSIPMTEDDSQAILEYACHEGNMALRNALAGARAKENAARTSGTGAGR